MKRILELRVNGETYEVLIEPWWSLARALREQLGLTGTKISCETGECGACTVLIEGAAVRSCQTRVADVPGKAIITLEGLGSPGNPHPLQTAFINEQVPQCGYCTSGMIMSAAALLSTNKKPSESDIRSALDGNLCRCGTHVRVVRAVMTASGQRG